MSTRKQFQRDVLNLLRQVPEGRVTTYGELARALTGSVRAARAVGQAVARNPQPITIPCHRVVRSTGEVGEYGGGVSLKIQLLRAEGVEIVDGKVVDFEHKVFRFDAELGKQLRFLTDRMFGKLTTWLRILGYDTLYAADLPFRTGDTGDEDNTLARVAAREGRILLTRDKELIASALRKGTRCILMKADEVLDQLQELQQHVPLTLEPVPERCSECNARIRTVEAHERALLRQNSYVPQDMIGTWEFWVCDRCGRIYWAGGHWRDIRERLKRLTER